MTLKPISVTLASTLLCLAFSCSGAHSSEVASVMALCDANPACSHSIPDKTGRVIFKLRLADSTKTIQCEWDGRCLVVLPRGQTVTVKDVPATLNAN